MSKKRTRAGRKKQLKTRTARGGSKRQESIVQGKPRRDEPDMGQSSYEDPEIQTESEGGGGMLLKMRGTMNRRETGDDASTLHKQRSLGEWALWLAAAAAIAFFVIRYIKGSGG